MVEGNMVLRKDMVILGTGAADYYWGSAELGASKSANY